jgi:16S rRNA (guanine1207-N2)-methyltransferase
VTHYFTDNRNLKENRKEHSFRFSGHLYTFVTDNGVFSKTGVDYGTLVLLESCEKENLHGEILDMGCGYGAIGIVLKGLVPSAHVTCADVNPRACELTAINAEKNELPVEVLVSDGYAAVEGSFDAIVTNPPIRAGKKVIYPMFEDAFAHLHAGGIFLAVIRRAQGAESAQKKLLEVFGNCEIISRDRGYWVLKCVKN